MNLPIPQTLLVRHLALDTTAGSRVDARRLALTVCLRVIEDHHSLSHALDQELPRLDKGHDRGFCTDMCYGVCRYYHVLNKALQSLLKKPLKSGNRDLHMVLLLGLYQLRFMRVAQHAAVNETVKLTSALNKSWARGLVNAVLRNYVRELNDAQESDEPHELSAEEHLQAYPAWLIQRISLDWPDKSESIFAAGNQQPPMVIRVDTARVSRDAYCEQLAAAGLGANHHPLVDSALVLDQPISVESLPGFDVGLVSVQDASAQLAAPLLDCQPGLRVLDACAAPGGKTLHLLQRNPNLNLLALDKDSERLERVQQNLTRAGQSANLVHADAADVSEWFDGEPFDRILLDAPCTASGIIRRHPDIRLLRQAGDIDGLRRQQERLLNALWPLLMPGGRLLYSTCSLFKAENEQQIGRFLRLHQDCMEVPLKSVKWGLERRPGRQILPGMDQMDGFYYACLEKRP